MLGLVLRPHCKNEGGGAAEAYCRASCNSVDVWLLQTVLEHQC